MDSEKIARINALAQKGRDGKLTTEEKVEQKLLREQYIAGVRRNFKQTLESIKYKD